MMIRDMTHEQVVSRKCKYCQSEHVIKYGFYKGIQRYYCVDCRRKFVFPESGMWYSDHQVSDAILMYYNGMSLSKISINMIEQKHIYATRVSIYNWVQRMTQKIKRETEKYQPEVGNVWVFIETLIRINRKNITLWDIIDTKTRFLLASELFETNAAMDAQLIIRKACERAGKYPKVVFIDKLEDYFKGITHPTGQFPGKLFDIRSDVNFVEQFRPSLEDRTNVMQHLKSVKNARMFLDGWLTHYNFFKPNPSINNKTPGQVSGISITRRVESAWN